MFGTFLIVLIAAIMLLFLILLLVFDIHRIQSQHLKHIDSIRRIMLKEEKRKNFRY